MKDREALVRELFPQRGLVVEVGTDTGAFAERIAHACLPRALFLVDAWRFLPGEYERDPMNRAVKDFEVRYRRCVQRIGRRPNVLLLRMLSEEAAPLFASGSLDAVYLDGDHTRPGIEGDLERWWPRVRSGGVLAGHDYTRRPWIDVIAVVDEFVAREGLELLLSGEPDIRSWAVRRP